MKTARALACLFFGVASPALLISGCSADEGLPREPLGQQQQALTCYCQGTPETCPPDNACVAYSCKPCCTQNCEECSATYQQGACDDGNPCTVNDSCNAVGQCTGGQPNTCNDNNDCTVDTCDASAGGCKHTPEPAAKACNDGNACTSGDHCSGTGTGSCVGGTNISCDDGKVCTSDSCDPQNGCKYTPLANGTACDDGNPCTSNTKCDASTLACGGGTPLSCDDGNACTTEICNSSSGGCVYTNNTNPCSDGNVCTQNDACSAGSCKPGTAVICNDNNPCTNDTCNASSGCVYTNKPNTTTCDDGNSCSTGDQCTSGVCAGTGGLNCNDNNPCTKNTCSAGVCQYPNEGNGTACDDGNKCTVTDSCQNGACAGTGAPNCDDNNECTTDSCDPTTGCKHDPKAGTCSDGNPCTENDGCNAGTCQPGKPISCVASDECHKAGACDSTSGKCATETVQPDDTPCTGGKCKGGTCVLTSDAGADSGTDSGTDGAAGTGGTGTGGSGGAAGSSGGAAGAGGSGTGGAATGGSSSGGTGTGSGGKEATFTPEKQGCACRVPSGRENTPGAWALVGLAALAFVARRRRPWQGAC